MRKARSQVFFRQRAPRIGNCYDQLVGTRQAQRGEKAAGHHRGVAGGVERTIAKLGDLREKRQAIETRDGRHETVAGHTVRHLVLGKFRITGIMPSQLTHNSAADQLIERYAIKLNHSSKCLRERKVQLS